MLNFSMPNSYRSALSHRTFCGIHYVSYKNMIVRHFVPLAFAMALLVPVAGYAEPNYYLDRCFVSDNSVSLRFVGSGARVRRIHLDPTGVTLSGDVKGYAKLNSVESLSLEPMLRVQYFSGQSVAFGTLTAQCRAKIRSVAKKLSIAVGTGSNG
jgi:hypothetical protein